MHVYSTIHKYHTHTHTELIGTRGTHYTNISLYSTYKLHYNQANTSGKKKNQYSVDEGRKENVRRNNHRDKIYFVLN